MSVNLDAVPIVTIACEASNQPHSARVGVAASILNRVRARRFGPTAAAVCLRRFQYSEWNGDAADNRNLERVLAMSPDDPVLVDCALAWQEALAGQDPTDGATFFYADTIEPPYWAKPPGIETAKLGALIFWKNVP